MGSTEIKRIQGDVKTSPEFSALQEVGHYVSSIAKLPKHNIAAVEAKTKTPAQYTTVLCAARCTAIEQ